MKRFGLFQIGQLDYAISLLQILKILQNSTTYVLPRFPRAVSAVLVDGAQLIPLLDLGQLLGENTQQEKPAPGYQVLVESEYGIVALPADLTGRIVAEPKGELLAVSKEKDVGIVGRFKYQNKRYNILDIDFLVIEIIHGFWQNQPDTGGARRHQL
jgi:chemotaxis signal transduction protein